MDTINKNLQENILTLLVWDKSTAPLLVSHLKPELFDNVFYRNIAEKCINFYEEYDNVIQEHLPDVLEVELEDEKKKGVYERILKNIYDNKETVNKDFVLNKLDEFLRGQQLKIDLKVSADLVISGKIEEAEARLYNSKKTRVELFDPGVFFGKDLTRTLGFKKSIEDKMIHTGIDYLDLLQHIPTKGEVFTLLGKSGAKKSWFCIYLCKIAMLQRYKVLYVTLELDEDRVLGRTHQAFFGIASRLEDLQKENAVFETDKYGRISNIDFSRLPKLHFMTDKNIIDVLEKKLGKLRSPSLLIKEFPSGSLSINMLDAYLKNLEAYYNWIPDIVILDYLDLMDIDLDKYRIDLGRMFVEFRGMCKKRNFAGVTVAQTNRVAEGVKLITRKHIGEDFSKIKTTDILVTSNQTEFEAEHGLLRLYIDKGRNGKDGDQILISQNISIGQYCLHSALMSKDYWNIIKEKEETIGGK
jgi:hypothetical protein